MTIKNSGFRKMYQQTAVVVFALLIVLVTLSMIGVIQPQMLVTGEIIERQPGTSSPESIIQIANGIEVTSSNFRRSGDMILTNVCYTLPDGKDWQLREVSLEYGDRVVREYGAEWIQDAGYPATDTTPGQRCVKLKFMADQQPGYSGWHRVTIGVLYAEPSENEYCTTFLMEVQQALEQRETGIKVRCSEPPVGGVEIASIPKGMTMEEANEYVHNKEFQYSLRGIHGPWIFEFTLEE